MARYALISELGRGAMGVVWRAVQVDLQRDVALKLISPDLAADPGLVQRFHREARTLAGLTHPGVVRVFDAGEMDGQLFYAMELLEGRDLWAVVQDSGPLPMGQLASVAAQAAAALAYVHEVGLTHRDVKPANLFLEAGGRVVLTDFGLVSDLDGTGGVTRAGARVGTPRFLAPELVAGRGATPASDIWALAVSIHELLTARSSGKGTDVIEVFRQIRDGPPLDLTSDGVNAPPWLLAAQAHAFARDPRQRATAEQLRAVFDARVDREARRALEMTLNSVIKITPPAGGIGVQTLAEGDPPRKPSRRVPALGAAASGPHPAASGTQPAVAQVPRGVSIASRKTGTERAVSTTAAATAASRRGSRGPMLVLAVALLVAVGAGARSLLAPRTPGSGAHRPPAAGDFDALVDGPPRPAGHRAFEVHLKEPAVVEAWHGERRVAVGSGQAGERVKLTGLPTGRRLELRLLRQDRVTIVTQLDTPRIIPVTRFVCWPSERDLLVDFDLASPTACKVVVEKLDGSVVEVAEFPAETASVHRVFRQLTASTAYVVRVVLPSGWGGLGGYEVRTYPLERAGEIKTFFAQMADPALLGWMTSVFENRPDLRMLPVLRTVIPQTPPDQSAALRRMARAVGSLRDADVAGFLVPHVPGIVEEGALSRGVLIQALADARRPEAPALAREWLTKSKNPAHLISCADAMSRTPSRAACDAILAELERSGEPAELAAYAMRADPGRAAEVLRSWSAPTRPVAQQHAAARGFEELAALGGPGEAELLAMAAAWTRTDAPASRESAASNYALEALARVGGAGARGVLVDAYRAAPLDLGRLWIIGRRGLAEGVAAVEKAFTSSTSAAFRRDALCVLGLLEAPAARDTIVRALADPDAEVALAASWALARQDTGARERMMAALTPDAHVRARALDTAWPRDEALARHLLVSVTAWERAGFEAEPGDTLVATLEPLLEGGPGSRRAITLCIGTQEQTLERGRQSVVVTGRGEIMIALRRTSSAPERGSPSAYRLALRRGP